MPCGPSAAGRQSDGVVGAAVLVLEARAWIDWGALVTREEVRVGWICQSWNHTLSYITEPHMVLSIYDQSMMIARLHPAGIVCACTVVQKAVVSWISRGRLEALTVSVVVDKGSRVTAAIGG